MGLPRYDRWDHTVIVKIVEMYANRNSIIKASEIIDEFMCESILLKIQKEKISIFQGKLHIIL